RIYLSSMKIRQEINDREGIAIAHNNLGLIYLKLRNYSEALKNHVAALKIRNEIGDKKGIATSYNNIGFVYEEQGNYPNALENYYAAIKIKQEIGDKEGMAITYNNIGDIYLKQNHAAEAKKMQLLSLKFIQEINAKAELMYAYASLALCDSSLGNFKSAYEYYKLYSSSKDSVINEKSIRQIQEMQTKYETEKKEIEIKSQALKILEQKQKLYLNNIALIALVAGIILLLIIIFLIISRNRIRKKEIIQTELLNQQAARTKIIIDTQEKERKRIAQDLHDGIGQTLAAIKMNISSKSNFIDEKDKKIFEHTMTAIDNAYHEVRMLSHSVMPKALKASGLAGAINDLLQQTLLNSRIKYIFEKNIPHRFKEETEVSLYRIFQELFNNILKHANATEISIHLHTANEQIILMVEDNGVGILNSQAQRKDVKGIGLSNIETRVQALHGTFSINTVAGKGTIAIIRIPTSENV
ncbi:MAG TPA: sensor histidine kinase, partial [Bacteroidia bacterium]